MADDRTEEELLRSVALQNAAAVLMARRRAEEALAAEQERLRVTLASIGDGVISTDADGRVVFLNAVAEALTGWTQADAVGRPLSDVFRIVNENTREPVENPALRALREGVVVGLANHTVLLARDGTERPIDDSAAPMRDASGTLVGAVLVFRDVTERRRAEELRARLAAIVDSSEDAIVSKTLDGVIRSWNAAAERIFGFTAGEAVGRPITLIIPPDRLDEERMIIDRVGRGGRVEPIETVRVAKGGRRLHISLTVSPVRDAEGMVTGASTIARDVTDRKRAEGRLAAQHAVTLALAESEGLAEAAPGILRAVCEHLDWDVGTLWAADRRDGTLRCSAVWHPADVAVPGFEAATRASTFRPGAGLPGRVWAAAAPVWVPDLGADANFPRAAAALADGLRAGFGAPIVLGSEVLGVVEFFSREARPPDEAVLGMMAALGSQVGQFVERTHVERELRESEGRYRAIVEATPECVKLVAPDGTLLQMNRAGLAMVEGDASAIGQCVYNVIAPEDRDRFRAFNERVCRGEGGALEFDVIGLKGTRRHMETKAVPLPAPGGGFTHLAVTRDVTETQRVAAALRESEGRFRQLADAMPQIVWSAGPDGVIDYTNRRWHEFSGTEEGVGNDMWRAVVHPDDLPPASARWAASVRGGAPFEMEMRLLDRRAGGYRWHLLRTVPVRTDAGPVARWFGTATDIDETKRAAEKTRFLADASAALAELTDYESTLQKVAALAVPFFADWCAVDMQEPDGTLRRLAVTHADPGKVQLAHELARRYPPDPADPRGVMKVLRTREPEWVPVITGEVLAASARDADHHRIVCALGLKSYVCVPLKSRGRALGALTFVTAESGRVYDADDLRAAEDLAHRAVIAVENAGLVAALRDADRRKDEFLALLAHELRNPLAPLRNGLEAMRLAGGLPDAADRARDRMERQLAHMVRLVDDLLDVSRISRGKVELRRTRVRLAEAVATAVETARPVIDAAEHELTVELPKESIVLDADLTRLAQVFANLLTNSAKYTERGGRIWLAAAPAGGEVVVTVRDTGIGIPADMLTRIFDMFSQVDRSVERATGGLGIGLALVKGLVEMHGGTVGAESEGAGRGSTFTVRLPVAVPSDERPAAGVTGGARAKGAAGRRILVVDDNRDGAESLAEMLLLLGHEAHTAYDGLEAVAATERLRPDVVLMDVGMPRLNGLDATRRIRAEPWGRGVKVIALTGWGQDADRERSREAGCDGHLVKPVGLAELGRLLTGLTGVTATP